VRRFKKRPVAPVAPVAHRGMTRRESILHRFAATLKPNPARHLPDGTGTETSMRPFPSDRGALRAIVTVALVGGAAGPACAGGLLLYEVGTADVGLAAAGYAARAQDAATAFTNPAGMTRLEGTQVVAGGQLMWLNQRFSIGSGTSPGLGDNDGGRAVGWSGFVPGGGLFVSHALNPDLRVGLSIVANFGSVLDYDDDWVGRYRVQEATILGVQFVPSIAYRVNERLSVGGGLNIVRGIFSNRVAINNLVPSAADGRLELSDGTWGFGANLGVLYQATPETRVGLTWTSQIDLDFAADANFSDLGPGLSALLGARGLLNARVDLGMKIPQQLMGSVHHRIDDRWAVMGNVGWQQWSKFGEVAVGIDNAANPVGLTTSLPFRDTWHAAVGAQYRANQAWTLNFGVAYDSGFQPGGQVSPLLPVNSAWRFGVGGEQQLDRNLKWGIAGAFLYGGTLDVAATGAVPPAAGGRGNLVGTYDTTASFVVSVYGNWSF
jgi:long-chain fatty acid transport protein